MLATRAGGTVPQIAVRIYFAPGDLVWHVDRVSQRTAFRLLWPLGRPAGMRVTPADNIDDRLYRAYMRRKHPLLGSLDTRVLRTGAQVALLTTSPPPVGREATPVGGYSRAFARLGLATPGGFS